MAGPRSRWLTLTFMAVLLVTAPASTGCADLCAGTDCAPPGVYVFWTADELPAAETVIVCVDGSCGPATPSHDLMVGEGDDLRPALHVYAPVPDPAERAVAVRLELHQGARLIASVEGTGTLEDGCCGHSTEMRLVDGALRDRT